MPDRITHPPGPSQGRCFGGPWCIERYPRQRCSPSEVSSSRVAQPGYDGAVAAKATRQSWAPGHRPDCMVKALFLSIIVVPALLGLEMGKKRRRRRSLWGLVAALLAYDIFYLLFLYYVRGQWI